MARVLTDSARNGNCSLMVAAGEVGKHGIARPLGWSLEVSGERPLEPELVSGLDPSVRDGDCPGKMGGMLYSGGRSQLVGDMPRSGALPNAPTAAATRPEKGVAGMGTCAGVRMESLLLRACA